MLLQVLPMKWKKHFQNWKNFDIFPVNIEQYRRWNIAVGGSVVFSLLMISVLVYLLQLPCPELLKNNTPCILCGCTRDFILILSRKTAEHNPLSEFLFTALAVEIFFRIAALSMARASRVRLFVILEVVFHLIMVTIFIVNIAG